jgi:hypothetical protein
VPGGGFETIADVVVQDFASIAGAGEIVNNPLVQTKEFRSYPSVLATFTLVSPVEQAGFNWGDDIGPQGAFIDLLVPYSLDTNMKDLIDQKPLVMKAAIEARNRISPILVQSLVSVAELPKTINLLGDTIKSLAKIIRGVKKGNWADVLEGIGSTRKVRSYPNFVRDSAAKRWLELRYGWTPLIMEVQGTIKALSKRDPIKPRATSRRVVSKTAISEWDLIQSQAQFSDQHFHYIFSKRVDARAYCLYEAELTTRSARDFGVTEFPLAAWELVPFSFVVDWFIPVGNWIEALTPKLGIKILAEGVVVKNRRILRRILTAFGDPIIGPGQFYQRSGYLNLTDELLIEKKERIPSLDVLYQLPSPDVKLNVKRITDALALMAQVGRKTSIRT